MAQTSGARTTMRLAISPSAALPPPPSFVFEVPDGWLVEDAPSVLAVARSTTKVADYWPNLVVTSDRVPGGVSLRDASIATFVRFKEQHPEHEVRVERLGNLGGRMTYLRALDITVEGRPLTQIHALFFAPRREEVRTADLFQLVGTCPTSTIGTIGVQILHIVSSFRFT
jgi:hypothetical protein